MQGYRPRESVRPFDTRGSRKSRKGHEFKSPEEDGGTRKKMEEAPPASCQTGWSRELPRSNRGTESNERATHRDEECSTHRHTEPPHPRTASAPVKEVHHTEPDATRHTPRDDHTSEVQQFDHRLPEVLTAKPRQRYRPSQLQEHPSMLRSRPKSREVQEEASGDERSSRGHQDRLDRRQIREIKLVPPCRCPPRSQGQGRFENPSEQ